MTSAMRGSPFATRVTCETRRPSGAGARTDSARETQSWADHASSIGSPLSSPSPTRATLATSMSCRISPQHGQSVGDLALP